MNKKGLGKGLSALIPTSDDVNNNGEPVTELDIKLIKPNTFQPRRTFDEEKLLELADSIKEHGVVQPVIVRAIDKGKYELVVGERRLRACEKISRKKIPAIIKELSNKQMMEIALIENIQRQDLNPVEESFAYKKLMEEFKLTQEEVAKRVSKSRSLIANMVRLLNLPETVLKYLSQGYITVGHARPLLAIVEDEMQINIAEEIIDKKLSVRETENFIKKLTEQNNNNNSKSKQEIQKSPVLIDIESKLRSVCGTKVKIKNKGEKGSIEIEYYNTDDFERIISLFTKDQIV